MRFSSFGILISIVSNKSQICRGSGLLTKYYRMCIINISITIIGTSCAASFSPQGYPITTVFVVLMWIFNFGVCVCVCVVHLTTTRRTWTQRTSTAHWKVSLRRSRTLASAARRTWMNRSTGGRERRWVEQTDGCWMCLRKFIYVYMSPGWYGCWCKIFLCDSWQHLLV